MDYMKMLEELKAEYPKAAAAVDELQALLDEEAPAEDEMELPELPAEDMPDEEVDDMVPMG